jgi:geranylgeranyl pyrophosphate synthase
VIERPHAGGAALEHFLAALDTRMRAEIARTPAALPARMLLDAGGKRLRAQLLWWSANATAPAALDPENERLVRAATAIEFAHLGSLIHDDIVDGGETRRGIATLHHQYGVRIATDAGTALAHLANQLVTSLGRPARQAVRRAILATCRGQVRELATPFVLLTPRARLAIMQEKTAAFFELAATLGALVGEAPRAHRRAVRRFARRFGVAFQIADDVLDLAGDPMVLGRSNGADLRDGVLTLPVLLAADHDRALARALDRVRLSPDAEALAVCAALIERGSGVTLAASVAAWWFEEAVRALAILPPTRAAIELIALTRASVTRGLQLGRPCFATTTADSRTALQPSDWVVDAQRITPGSSAARISPRLISLLEWFRPGLSELVAVRTCGSAVHARRERHRHMLLQGDCWSRSATIAADAIALACALANDDALLVDCARTLALIDALHCAAIGLLNDETDPREQTVMAARTHELWAPWPSSAAALSFPLTPIDSTPAVALNA